MRLFIYLCEYQHLMLKITINATAQKLSTIC